MVLGVLRSSGVAARRSASSCPRGRVSGRRSPRGWGRGRCGQRPRAWRFNGRRALPRCVLPGPGGARGAACRARESAAAASNPPLSSLRLRHARSAERSRARRAAVAARGARGAGDVRRGRGESPGDPAGSGATSRGKIEAPLGASPGAQVALPDRQPPEGGGGARSRGAGEGGGAWGGRLASLRASLVSRLAGVGN